MAELKTRDEVPGSPAGAGSGVGATLGAAPVVRTDHRTRRAAENLTGAREKASTATSAGRSAARSRWAALMLMLAAALVVLAVLDTVLLIAGTDPTARERGPALDTARRVALDLSREGPDDLDARLASLHDATTGALQTRISDYADVLRGQPDQGRTVDAEVGTAALDSIDEDGAVALVTVSATLRGSPDGAEAAPVRRRLELRLVREDTGWKVVSAESVP
jgi:hypothetical protein